MTVARAARDPEALRRGFERWLQARHRSPSVRVGPLVRPTSGYSSETLLIDSRRTDGAAEVEERFVARLPPAGGDIFPTYDLDRQAAVQRALSRAGIPVATVVAVEHDEEWVGAPFLLMAHVEGVVLDEAYVVAGPLHAADAATQRRVQHGFVDLLAAVHRLDWEAAGLGALTPPAERGLAHDLARAGAYLEWAADGDVPAVLADALAWLRAGRPEPEPPPALCWGDPRLGNVVYRTDFSVAAALDWETAAIGPAELDLAWFVGLHDLTATAVGADLPGFAGRDEVVARWADRVGRAAADLGWFEVMSLLRADSVLLRIRRLVTASGQPDPWPQGPTPGQARIASLIAAPPSRHRAGAGR